MEKIITGVSLMPNPEFIQVTLPLFEEGIIDVLEWSFDIINSNEPEWICGLLNEYANSDRLLGHGVYYSLFDAEWNSRQDKWLINLKNELQKRKYNHISEHFGFMSTNDNYHQGVPLPIPLNAATFKIGVDRLKRIQEITNLPVGIENLAFSFSKENVQEQGDFIDKLTNKINGFIILDLHNIYCQSCNFNIDMMELIESYPLEKVREIHVSGGSWQESIYSKNKKIRRDTHDDEVPNEIFEILPAVIKKCTNLEFVILERLGDTFTKEGSFENYRTDYKRLRKIVNSFSSEPTANYGKQFTIDKKPLVDIDLLEEQKKIAGLLTDKNNLEEIKKMSFKNFNVKQWDLEMINTAMEIVAKWNN